MVAKPAPSKLVLLMSAAGLGLSCSGVALAARDSHAPASVSLTFGVAPTGEQDCKLDSHVARASCASPSAELLRNTVAESVALPLLPATIPVSSDVQASFRAFHDYPAETARPTSDGKSGDGELPPRHDTLDSEAPVIARNIGAPSRDPVADPIAHWVLDIPQALEGDGEADSSLTDHPAPAAQRMVPSVALQVYDAGVRRPVEQADGSAHKATDVRDQPRSPRKDGAGKAIEDDRSANNSQVEAPMEPAEVASAAIDRVFASLAEVLGAQLEDSAIGPDRSSEQAAESKRLVASPTLVVDHPTAPRRVELAALATRAANSIDSSLERSTEADDIVVASSHSDKVLMSLAAVRSSEDSPTIGLGAQTKKTVVVRHSEKVLETLALFRSKKSEHSASACSLTSKEGQQLVMPAEPSTPRTDLERITKTTLAGSEVELDILLDLLPPVASQADRQMLQAAAPIPAPSDHPVANTFGRSAFGADMVALSTDKLDEVRGGFVTDGGLKISFGIERAVYLNGNLVTTTSLNISDLSRISGGQSQVTGTGKDSLALLQSGTGNILSPGSISSTAAGTVIQNTLDNQKINTITRIDAVVNSSGIMRSINLQSSMQSAIVNSLRR